MRLVSTWRGKALPLAGGIMTGDIAMGGSKVTGQGEPDTAKDGLRYGHSEIGNAEIAVGADIVYAKLYLTGKLLMADLATAIKNAADGLVVLDASADVPLAQIPNTLTGKDADTLDGSELSAITSAIATAVSDHAALLIHSSVKRKPDDEIRNNSDTLVNDEDLVISVGANDVWLIHLIMLVQSAGSTPDIDYLFTVPSGGAIGA
ncbi:unnamed protein product, partial [marine sediment metagenome]